MPWVRIRGSLSSNVSSHLLLQKGDLKGSSGPPRFVVPPCDPSVLRALSQKGLKTIHFAIRQMHICARHPVFSLKFDSL